MFHRKRRFCFCNAVCFMVAEKRRCGYGMRNFCNSTSKLQKNVENRCFFPKFVTFVANVAKCRVNKQVQNYFKSLKNSTKGEEKFGFSRDLQLILTCTISNGLWSMTRKSMHFGKYCLKRWAEWCAMARVWAAGAVFVGQKGGGFVK